MSGDDVPDLTWRRARDECPGCGAMNDAATSVTGGARAPRAGDIGICWRCATVMTYTDDGVERCTDDAVLANERVAAVQAAVIMAQSGM